MEELSNYFSQAESYYSTCEELERKVTSNHSPRKCEQGLTQLASNILNLSQEMQKLIKSSPSDSTDRKLCSDIDTMCQDLMQRTNRVASHLNKKILVEPDVGKGLHVSLVEEFKASGDSKTLEKVVEQLVPNFIKGLRDKGYQQLFPVYGSKVRAEFNEKKLIDLNNKKTVLTDHLKSTHQMLTNLDMEESTSAKKSIKILQEQVKVLEQIEKITTELASVEQEIAATEPKLAKHKANIEKGRETRALLQKLGGESTKITTADGVTVDGTFISSDRFRERLADDNAQIVTITRRFADGHERQIQGLSFKKADVEANKDHIVNNLFKMSGLPEPEKGSKGAGWNIVEDGDNLLLVPDSYMHDVLSDVPSKYPMIEPGSLQSSPSLITEGVILTRNYQNLDLSEPSTGGTIIMTSGNGGVYEMHKREMAAFLFKGLNVQAFNLRGYGLSDGMPSASGFEQDTESVYQYVKKKTQQEDKKILLLPFCLSGGAAAPVAANHPKVNIFLNQTYSDFGRVLEEQVIDFLQAQVRELDPEKSATKVKNWLVNNLQPLAKTVASSVAPDLQVAKNLAKNQGQKAIFFVHDDATISREHVEKNIRMVAEAGNMAQLTVFSAPGSHGSCWPNLESSPYLYSNIASEVVRLTAEAEQESERINNAIGQLKSQDYQELEQLRKLADKMEKEGTPSRNPSPILPKMTPQELRAYADTLAEKRGLELQILRKQASAAYQSKQDAIERLVDSVDPDEFIQSFTARSQMSHYLEKAHLSDDIIKTEFQQKKVENPILAELQENIEYLNAVYTELSQLLEQMAPLSNMKIDTLHITGDHHVFEGKKQDGSYTQLVVKNQLMDTLIQYQRELPSIRNRMLEVKSRDTKAINDKALEKLARTLENLTSIVAAGYATHNSQLASKWMDDIAELSKEADKSKLAMLKPLMKLDTIREGITKKQNYRELEAQLPAIELEMQSIQKAYSSLESQINALADAMKGLGEQTRDFPPEITDILERGLTTVFADINKIQTASQQELQATKNALADAKSRASWLSLLKFK